MYAIDATFFGDSPKHGTAHAVAAVKAAASVRCARCSGALGDCVMVVRYSRAWKRHCSVRLRLQFYHLRCVPPVLFHKFRRKFAGVAPRLAKGLRLGTATAHATGWPLVNYRLDAGGETYSFEAVDNSWGAYA